ncbi:hypothetical protein MHBO_002247 [Bonamia ostreae]|uniref:Rhodanese domain-containing protein n=1 Tax=Bonamia ostreae TaxID=126728 RepID=A0ABV2ALP5_9EUKA
MQRTQKRFFCKAKNAIYPMMQLNISSVKEGFVDHFFNSEKYNHLLPMEPLERDRFRWKSFKPIEKLNIQKDLDSIVFTKKQIMDLIPGYPVNPDYTRYLPIEVERLLNDEKTFIIDIREPWERKLAKLEKNDRVFEIEKSKFEFLEHSNVWGNFKSVENLLPTIFSDRNLNFTVVCGDGQYSEFFCALLYGHGWHNSSVMLGGINGLLETAENKLLFESDKRSCYDPHFDIMKSIIVDLKIIEFKGKNNNVTIKGK